jgi:CheY-like chemotaxis protein
MPELDGLATTRLIHDEEFPHHPYIIAVTANVTPEDRRRCLAAGMDDFLGKPLQIEALMAALRRGGAAVPAAAPATDGDGIEPSPVLPEALVRLRETLDDDDAWKSFVQISLESLANQLALLHQGLEAGDEAQVTRASHTLKSNAANVGEEALRQLCETLEALARQGDLEAVAEELTELQENVQRVRAGLVRLLRDPS